jgi:hypothetical protein
VKLFPGNKEFCHGLLYTALTRVKDFKNLKLMEILTFERYEQCFKREQVVIRIEEEERL